MITHKVCEYIHFLHFASTTVSNLCLQTKMCKCAFYILCIRPSFVHGFISSRLCSPIALYSRAYGQNYIDRHSHTNANAHAHTHKHAMISPTHASPIVASPGIMGFAGSNSSSPSSISPALVVNTITNTNTSHYGRRTATAGAANSSQGMAEETTCAVDNTRRIKKNKNSDSHCSDRCAANKIPDSVPVRSRDESAGVNTKQSRHSLLSTSVDAHADTSNVDMITAPNVVKRLSPSTTMACSSIFAGDGNRSSSNSNSRIAMIERKKKKGGEAEDMISGSKTGLSLSHCATSSISSFPFQSMDRAGCSATDDGMSFTHYGEQKREDSKRKHASTPRMHERMYQYEGTSTNVDSPVCSQQNQSSVKYEKVTYNTKKRIAAQQKGMFSFVCIAHIPHLAYLWLCYYLLICMHAHIYVYLHAHAYKRIYT